MAIPVICPNGHTLNAPDNLLGKSIRCPQCQQPVLVEMPVDLTDGASFDFDPLAASTPVATPSANRSTGEGQGGWQAPTRTVTVQPHLFETLQGKLGIIGSGLAAGALLGLLLLGIISLFRGSPTSGGGELASGDVVSGGEEVEESLPPGGPNPTDPLVREAVQKQQQILFGMQNYNESFRTFPPGTPKQSKLSWRVHILPFLGHSALYNKFQLKEPWDSAHNLPLLKEMPDAFKLGDDTEKTRFQIIASDVSAYNGNKPPKLSEITDGLASTICAVVVGPDKAVEWTRPDDFSFDHDNPVASLGKLPGDVIVCQTFTQVLALGTQVDSKEFLALITRKGKEISDPARTMQITLKMTPSDLAEGRPPRPNTKPGELPKPIVPPGGKFTLQQQVQLAAFGLMSHRTHFKMFCPTEAPTVGALSWRVHILPYMGHMELYREFDLSENWDGPKNSKLLSKIPACFNTGDGSKTRIQGTKAVLGFKRTDTSLDDPQGTLLTMAVPASMAIEWTKPDEFGSDPQDAPKLLAALGNDSLEIMTYVGQPLKLSGQALKDNLAALCTPNHRVPVNIAELSQGEKIPIGDVLIRRLMAQSAKDRERADRMRQVMLAMHNYESTYKRFPPNAQAPTLTIDGNQTLSWRVLLLPFLDQVPLYEQFNLDEPWDSPHNKQLIDKMPTVFADPEVNSYTASCIARIGGPETMFSKTIGPKFSDVGNIAQAVAIAHVPPDESNPWTKPGDLEIDVKNPTALKSIPTHRFILGFADGSIRFVKSSIPNEQLGSILSANSSQPWPPWLAMYGLD